MLLSARFATIVPIVLVYRSIPSRFRLFPRSLPGSVPDVTFFNWRSARSFHLPGRFCNSDTLVSRLDNYLPNYAVSGQAEMDISIAERSAIKLI